MKTHDDDCDLAGVSSALGRALQTLYNGLVDELVERGDVPKVLPEDESELQHLAGHLILPSLHLAVNISENMGLSMSQFLELVGYAYAHEWEEDEDEEEEERVTN